MNQNPDIPEIFRYEQPSMPEDCKYIISPSMIYKFFTSPVEWYKTTILGENTFLGNTASITGTICHHIYKQVATGGNVCRNEINEQLEKYLTQVEIPDVDINKIKTDYPEVTMRVVNDYLLTHMQGHGKVEVEKPVYTKVADGIYLAGTCDRVECTATYFCSNKAYNFLKEKGLL